MYNLAICDVIINEFKKRRLSVKVLSFDNAENLLNELKNATAIDAVFLDIAMPGVNGIQAGKWLKNNTLEIPLIYVSSRDDMVFKTFQAKPLQYIRKTRLKEELPGVIDELLEELNNLKENDSFEITADNREVFRFHSNEIMYIEVIGKECQVFLSGSKDSCSARCRLKIFEDILCEKGFIKIHKSFLVNYRYIFQIRAAEVQLDNGKLLPISRHRLNDVKAEFMKYSGFGDTI